MAAPKLTLDQCKVRDLVRVKPPAGASYLAFVECVVLPLHPGFIKVRHIKGRPTRTVLPEWLTRENKR